MNRHGSSFGSNNCSKRVVFFVSIHFLCCGFGRVLRSASTGDAPFLGVPKSPVFSPASPVLGPASPFWGSKSPHFSTFFVFFYIDFMLFFMFIHELCAFSRFFVKFSFRTKHKMAVFQGVWRLFATVEFSIIVTISR